MKFLAILGFLVFVGFSVAWTFFHLGRLVGALNERCRKFARPRRHWD